MYVQGISKWLERIQSAITVWGHPTSLLVAPSKAPSNTYIGQTAALFRAPLTTHASN